MRGEGVIRTESSATIVPAPRGGWGAAVAWGDSTGSASAIHRAVEVFTAFFFFFPFSDIEGSGRLVVKDDRGTSAYTVGDLDPDWVSEEGITDSADIFSEKEKKENTC